jgi:hypothetical protein
MKFIKNAIRKIVSEEIQKALTINIRTDDPATGIGGDPKITQYNAMQLMVQNIFNEESRFTKIMTTLDEMKQPKSTAKKIKK